MKISSTAFAHNSFIPINYTCLGDNVSPPLNISKLPEGPVSMALILQDPDAPSGIFVHWLIWNIDPSTQTIPKGGQISATIGTNDKGHTGYDGPCPPQGSIHRYHFLLYALDKKIHLPVSSTRIDLLAEMEDHILATSRLIGKFQR